MPTPDVPLSCCCDWGTMRIGRTAPIEFFYSTRPQYTNWTDPDLTPNVTVEFIKRGADFVPVEWTATPFGLASVFELVADDQGNFYTISSSVRKFDSSYTQLWSFTHPDGTLTLSGRLYADGEYSVYAAYLSGSGSAGDSWAKVDSSGSLVWTKSVTDIATSIGISSGVTEMTNGYARAVSYDNQSFYTGFIHDDGAIHDLYLVELDASDGSYINHAVISTTSGNMIQDIAVDIDGNLYLWTVLGNNVRCFDSGLSLLWSREFASGVTQTLSFLGRIAIDANKDIFAAGRINGSGHGGIKKINGSTQADDWIDSLSTMRVFAMAVGKSGNVFITCISDGGAASGLGRERLYLGSDGTLIGSDFSNQNRFHCCAAPGIYPHFFQ